MTSRRRARDPDRRGQGPGLSLTRYMLRELEHLAKRSEAVRANADVIRQTQEKVRGHVDRDTILTALHEGRRDKRSSTPALSSSSSRTTLIRTDSATRNSPFPT